MELGILRQGQKQVLAHLTLIMILVFTHRGTLVTVVMPALQYPSLHQLIIYSSPVIGVKPILNRDWIARSWFHKWKCRSAVITDYSKTDLLYEI